MQRSLGPGPRLLFRHKWKNWKHYFVIYLCWWIRLHHCFDWVFSIRVSGFGLKFSRFLVSRERLQKDSEPDKMTNGLILGFFWNMLFSVDLVSVWTVVFKSSSNLFHVWRHQAFRKHVCDVFWSVLEISFCFLAIGFCNIDW